MDVCDLSAHTSGVCVLQIILQLYGISIPNLISIPNGQIEICWKLTRCEGRVSVYRWFSTTGMEPKPPSFIGQPRYWIYRGYSYLIIYYVIWIVPAQIRIFELVPTIHATRLRQLRVLETRGRGAVFPRYYRHIRCSSSSSSEGEIRLFILITLEETLCQSSGAVWFGLSSLLFICTSRTCSFPALSDMNDCSKIVTKINKRLL